MDFISVLRTKFYENPQELLDKAIVFLNEEKSKNNEIAIDKSNVLESEQYSVGQLASLLRDANCLTRVAGRELDKGAMMSRLSSIIEGEPPKKYFVPSAFGYNSTGFWFPVLSDMLFSVIMIALIVGSSHLVYRICEHYHSLYGCQYFINSFSPECYILKKGRATLEDLQYYILYASVCAIGVAFTGVITKTRVYASNLIN